MEIIPTHRHFLEDTSLPRPQKALHISYNARMLDGSDDFLPLAILFRWYTDYNMHISPQKAFDNIFHNRVFHPSPCIPRWVNNCNFCNWKQKNIHFFVRLVMNEKCSTRVERVRRECKKNSSHFSGKLHTFPVPHWMLHKILIFIFVLFLFIRHKTR